MLTETLTTGLEKYRIGPKVRSLRLNKRLGLAELGQHTGLSAALLSKIERGQLFPTLPTLLRIALVFGVGLEHFFVETRQKPAMAITRRGERLRLPERPGVADPAYYFESLNFPITERKMEAYLAEFPRDRGTSAPHHHPGAELIYVVSGELALTVGGEESTLAAGDAAHFDSAVPHSYRQHNDQGCVAVVVTLPV